MRTSRLLKEARKALVSHGWVQGRTGSRTYGLCLDGALQLCTDTPATLRRARITLAGVIRETYGIYSIETWNDQNERTKAEVLELLDAAIAKYK